MEAIVNNLIKALGWSIFHSLWQGAIIYALLFTILMAFPKISAKLKHNFAFAALLLIFSSFCFTFYTVFDLPLSQSAITGQILSPAYPQLTLAPTVSIIKAEAWFPFLSSLYLTGIAVQLILLLAGYRRLKQLKQAHTMPIPLAWQAAFEQTLAQLKLNKPVQFLLSSKVNVPLVIGYFKPVVLFPVALATQLEIKQVEAILLHELSHIRRNDYMLNLVKTFIETLLFFNPFIWLASRFIHIEREHACDDLVVKYTGTPVTYAHALLKLELLKDKQAPALSLAATGKNQYLYQRIKRITNMKATYMNAKQQLFILALVLSTVFSLAWIKPHQQEDSKKIAKTTLSAQITEGRINHSRLVLNADTDSTKTKRKSKIFISDGNGNVKTYNSIKEVPDSLRKVVINNLFVSDSITALFNSPKWKNQMAELRKNSMELREKFQSPEWKAQMENTKKLSLELKKKFDSPEWKAQMKEMKEKFNSPEWKEQMEHAQKLSLEMKKKFDSPEWKAQMKEMKEKFNSPEWKEQMEHAQKLSLEMKKKFDSPEWKAQMDKIRQNSMELKKKFDSPEWKAQMDKIRQNSLELKKKFDSPEWKAQIEEMRKLQSSPEYKELKKKFDEDIEELKKSKGIKTDKNSFQFDADFFDNNFMSFTLNK